MLGMALRGSLRALCERYGSQLQSLCTLARPGALGGVPGEEPNVAWTWNGRAMWGLGDVGRDIGRWVELGWWVGWRHAWMTISDQRVFSLTGMWRKDESSDREGPEKGRNMGQPVGRP